MAKYFFNDDNGHAIIIDENTLERAERGETYLPPLCWWDLGECKTPADAHKKYIDLKADSRYCYLNDC
jgi:hypothetical protein